MAQFTLSMKNQRGITVLTDYDTLTGKTAGLTFDEKLNLSVDGSSLDFSMLKYLYEASNKVVNTAAVSITYGTVIQAIINNIRYDFAVTDIDYQFMSANVQLSFSTQDLFQFETSRLGVGYTIEADTTDPEYLGAQPIDYWARKIVQDNNLNWTYISIDDLNYDILNNYNSSQTNQVRENIQENIEDWLELPKTDYSTLNNPVSFECNGSNAYNALKQLATDNELFIWIDYSARNFGFMPLKNPIFNGYYFNPNNNLQNFSLRGSGSNLVTVLNVTGPQDINDQEITLMPSLPIGVVTFINSENWITSVYYSDLYTAYTDDTEFLNQINYTPWLENKLINIDFFTDSNILMSSERYDIENILNNDLRIANGRMITSWTSYLTQYENNYMNINQQEINMESVLSNLAADYQMIYQDINNHNIFNLAYNDNGHKYVSINGESQYEINAIFENGEQTQTYSDLLQHDSIDDDNIIIRDKTNIDANILTINSLIGGGRKVLSISATSSPTFQHTFQPRISNGYIDQDGECLLINQRYYHAYLLSFSTSQTVTRIITLVPNEVITIDLANDIAGNGFNNGALGCVLSGVGIYGVYCLQLDQRWSTNPSILLQLNTISSDIVTYVEYQESGTIGAPHYRIPITIHVIKHYEKIDSLTLTVGKYQKYYTAEREWVDEGPGVWFPSNRATTSELYFIPLDITRVLTLQYNENPTRPISPTINIATIEQTPITFTITNINDTYSLLYNESQTVFPHQTVTITDMRELYSHPYKLTTTIPYTQQRDIILKHGPVQLQYRVRGSEATYQTIKIDENLNSNVYQSLYTQQLWSPTLDKKYKTIASLHSFLNKYCSKFSSNYQTMLSNMYYFKNYWNQNIKNTQITYGQFYATYRTVGVVVGDDILTTNSQWSTLLAYHFNNDDLELFHQVFAVDNDKSILRTQVIEYCANISAQLTEYWNLIYSTAQVLNIFIPKQWDTLSDLEAITTNEMLISVFYKADNSDYDEPRWINPPRVNPRIIPSIDVDTIYPSQYQFQDDNDPSSLPQIITDHTQLNYHVYNATNNNDNIMNQGRYYLISYNQHLLNPLDNLQLYLTTRRQKQKVYNNTTNLLSMEDVLATYIPASVSIVNSIKKWLIWLGSNNQYDMTPYYTALAKHNEIWQSLYHKYPGIFRESEYTDQNAINSHELYLSARRELDKLSHPEFSYNLVGMDIYMHNSDFLPTQIKLGEQIRIDYQEEDQITDTLNAALREPLFITGINHTLRNDGDYQFTVTTRTATDTMVQRFAKLLNFGR